MNTISKVRFTAGRNGVAYQEVDSNNRLVRLYAHDGETIDPCSPPSEWELVARLGEYDPDADGAQDCFWALIDIYETPRKLIIERIKLIGAAEVARHVRPLWGHTLHTESLSKISKWMHEHHDMPSRALFALLSVLDLEIRSMMSPSP